MLTIVKGSLEEIKAEMKQVYNVKGMEIKHLKKKLKDEKNAQAKQPIQNKIDKLMNDQKLYKPSYIVPVKVDSIIIDFKSFELFMKKLKGFTTSIEIKDESLIVQYKSKGSSGSMHLRDLTEYFENFTFIPEAKIEEVAV